MKKNIRTTNGKYKTREIEVRWYCRNCRQRGLAGITVEKHVQPPMADLFTIVQTTCHSRCTDPDIRLASVV